MILRRTFLKYSFLTSVVVIIGGCKEIIITTTFQTISIMQQDLFPINLNTPTLKDINSLEYLSSIFEHPRVSKSDKESLKKFKRLYIELNRDEREEILEIISKEDWGRSFIREVMSYIYEALLCDPIYGTRI